MLATSALKVRKNQRKKRLIPGIGKGKGPRSPPRKVEAIDVYGKLEQFGDMGFRADTRFTKVQFDDLLNDIQEQLQKSVKVRAGVKVSNDKSKAGKKKKMALRDILLMALKFFVSGGDIQRFATEFGIQKPNEMIQHCVLAILLSIGAKELHVPSFNEQIHLLGMQHTGSIADVLFETDGTYSEAERRVGDYSGHRKKYVRTTQGTISLAGPFVAVETGIAGSVHDSVAFAKTSFYENIDELLLPGVKILADSAYSGLKRMYTQDEQKSAQKSASELQLYRSAVEHAFGKLKQLFAVTESWQGSNLRFQAQTMMACCVLYNRLLRLGNIEGSWKA